MRAIDKLLLHFDGNQTKAANALGKKQGHVWHWKNKADDMPTDLIPLAAQIMGVSKAELKPEIFGDDKAA